MPISALAIFRRTEPEVSPLRYEGQPVVVGSQHQHLVEACRQQLFTGSGGVAVPANDSPLRQALAGPLSAATFADWSQEFAQAFTQWFAAAAEGEGTAPELLVMVLLEERGVQSLLLVLTEERPGFIVTAELDVRGISAVAVDRGIRVLEMVLAGDVGAAPKARFAGRLGRKVGDPLFELLGLSRDSEAQATGAALARGVALACDAQGLAPAEQRVVTQSVGKLCRERYQQGAPVQRAEVAELVEQLTGAPQAEHWLSEGGIDQEAFMAAPVGFRKGSRFAGAGRGMSISFDRALLGQDIHFDRSRGTLTFTQLPANLIDQLRKAMEDDAPAVALSSQSD